MAGKWDNVRKEGDVFLTTEITFIYFQYIYLRIH